MGFNRRKKNSDRYSVQKTLHFLYRSTSFVFKLSKQ